MHVISINLGSNTLRVLKFSCDTYTVSSEFRQIIKVSDNLLKTNKISSEIISHIISALKDAQKTIDFSDSIVKAVATQAIRQATNRQVVLKKIYKETGIMFSVIEGEEEARVTSVAVLEKLKQLSLPTESFVLIDIGAGSTEIIYKFHETIIVNSFPIGIATITQRYQEYNIVKKMLIKEMIPINNFHAKVIQKFGIPKNLIATGGTPITLAIMKLGQTYDDFSINGEVIEMKELSYYFKMLLEMNIEKKIKLVGLGRENYIASGVLILEALFSTLGYAKAIVVDVGLIEGVALEYCRN